MDITTVWAGITVACMLVFMGFNPMASAGELEAVFKGGKATPRIDYAISDFPPQLVGLTGMRFSHQKAKKGRIIKIDFKVAEPVKVLVGYFQENRDIWLQVPMLEHMAHSNDRDGPDPVPENAADIGDANINLPRVNIHAFKYEGQTHPADDRAGKLCNSRGRPC